MPEIRYKAIYYAAEPLLAQCQNHQKLSEVLAMIETEAFQEVLDEIREEYDNEEKGE